MIRRSPFNRPTGAAANRCGTLVDLVRSAPSRSLWECLGYVVLIALGIELLVVSFFHRAVLTVGLAALSLWPLLTGLYSKAPRIDPMTGLQLQLQLLHAAPT
ncbi:hypothetical protein CRUP_004879 [Coryphaenoides rupestris]|nr:hypothetical protein CRUP_004879 [Coryphaenoides rupestris]